MLIGTCERGFVLEKAFLRPLHAVWNRHTLPARRRGFPPPLNFLSARPGRVEERTSPASRAGPAYTHGRELRAVELFGRERDEARATRAPDLVLRPEERPARL